VAGPDFGGRLQCLRNGGLSEACQPLQEGLGTASGGITELGTGPSGRRFARSAHVQANNHLVASKDGGSSGELESSHVAMMLSVGSGCRTVRTTDWSVVAILFGAASFLYVNLFLLPNTPYLLGGDQAYFWADAQRMLFGERPYQDFFQFTPPGTDLFYFVLFKVFGPRIWVTNMVVMVLGVALCWACFSISRQIMAPRNGLTCDSAVSHIGIYETSECDPSLVQCADHDARHRSCDAGHSSSPDCYSRTAPGFGVFFHAHSRSRGGARVHSIPDMATISC
jgi:hypothetical protein